MPNTAAAKKSLKQTIKKTAHNIDAKKKIEFLLRSLKKALSDKKLAEAEKFFQELQKAVDKASKVKVFAKNKASRIKSRIGKKIQSLRK